MHRRECSRETREGLHVLQLLNGSLSEAFITVPAVGDELPVCLLQRLYSYLEQNPQLRIVRQDVFGLVADPARDSAGRAYRLDGSEWPVTWVEEGNGGGCPVAGIQVHAVSGAPVTPIRMDGRVVGAVFEDAYARYCVLGGLRPDLAPLCRGEQVWRTFEKMEAALSLAGMRFANVVRTWFYLDDILDWYDEFNRVRNRFFQERRVYGALVPASTGVGGSNREGTAVVADLLAIEPKGPEASLQMVPSPLQCAALDYGSAFSRAVELTLPGQRRLFVSGTASIAPDGQTLHAGDVDAQVALSMEVVRGILNSRGMGWAEVTRAIGYFKHAEDVVAFARYCTAHRIPPLPAVIVKNDICRDDLLFEIEVDAVK